MNPLAPVMLPFPITIKMYPQNAVLIQPPKQSLFFSAVAEFIHASNPWTTIFTIYMT